MGFTPAVSSTRTPLYEAIVDVSSSAFNAQVVPTVSGGFTDSHFFRDLGITSYGYSPFAFTVAEFSGVHGNDERVSVHNIVNGIKVYYQLLQRFVVPR
jgi:acetylornithine deacetylase/succinyl-diaminopimelate desuccinylase-like protein